MANNVTIVAPGRVQSWRKKMIKQHLLSSFWDQGSNRFSHNEPVSVSARTQKPTTIVHKVTDELKEGQDRVTMLSLRKPAVTPIFGPNPAEGNEYKNTTLSFSCFFNNQRVPMVVTSNSVAGRMGKYYNLAEATADTINEVYMEQTDYDHERALIDGCDETLSNASYWQSSTYGSFLNAPCEDTLHPNIYVDGQAAKNTWSETRATAISNLYTLANNLTTSNVFGLAALDRIALLASRTTIALPGFAGNSDVKWILKLSDAQWHQLITEASTGFRDLLKYTEKGLDRAIKGWEGSYKGVGIVVSQRSAIGLFADAALTFKYAKPSGDERARVAKASGSGTCEVAALMGPGHLALCEIMEVDFERDGKDYNFNKNMCGERIRGTQRADLDSTVAPTSGRLNQSGFLYLTATTAGVV
jgi:hypothetical protein